MKKLFPASFLIASQVFARTNRRKTYRWIAVVLLAGCTNTQVRWDATRMREDVMVYYNDQIMDNLIKAKNKLPFVHVDIQTLTSTGGSQISGSVGYGETTSNTSTRQGTTRTTTDTSTPPGPVTTHIVATAVGTASVLVHAAMRPFTYSVSPQQTESLSIIAAPALGSQAVASPTPATTTPKPTWQETKKTTTANLEEPKKPTSIVTEEVLKSAPMPSPITIYKLYDDFAQDPPAGHLSHSSAEPKQGTYVPGTLKKGPVPEGGTEYYFIASNQNDQEAYYEFCKALFTKGQAGSLEKKLDVIQAATLR